MQEEMKGERKMWMKGKKQNMEERRTKRKEDRMKEKMEYSNDI